MFRISACGQDCSFLLLVFRRLRGTVFEAEAVIAGFENVAMMREAIEESGRHLGIAKDAGPFAEAQVGRDDDTGSLIELAEQMEEQCAA